MAVICDICDNCHFVYMHACVYAVCLAKGWGARQTAFFNMLIKLVQIPAYLAIFVLGVLFSLQFSLMLFCFFVLFDCITIFLTGLVGLTANLRLYKERKCSGSFAALNSVCQFVFV